jgi:hypothetical protein
MDGLKVPRWWFDVGDNGDVGLDDDDPDRLKFETQLRNLCLWPISRLEL